MGNERKCAEYIRMLVGKTAFTTYLCKVNSVDGATCEVERVMDGMIVKDVRLNAHIRENEGLVVIPKTDSYVLITDIDGDKWFVSQYSVIESITLDFDNTLTINSGNNAGLVKINELTQKLNELVNAFNTHTHTTTATVGATTAPGVIEPPLQQANPFNKTDYENDKIKH